MNLHRALRAPSLIVAALIVSAACSAAPIATPTPMPPMRDPLPIGDPPPVNDPGELTIPRPGQLDVREIPADLLEAAVDGRSVTIRITFTSGVEPCYVLDTIAIGKGDHAFSVTLREGHGPGDMACIEIAVTRHAIVELGELEPGTYTITDSAGGAAPIEVVVG